MFSDNELSIYVKGTTEDILAIKDALVSYENKEKDIYIKFLTIKQIAPRDENGVSAIINARHVNSMSDEELIAYIEEANNELYFTSMGPFGKFGLLEEVDILEKVAESAPNTSFTGYLTGDNQCVKGELKEGRLYLYYQYPEDSFEEGMLVEDDEDDDWDPSDDENVEEEDWDDISIYDPVAKDYLDPYDEE